MTFHRKLIFVPEAHFWKPPFTWGHTSLTIFHDLPAKPIPVKNRDLTLSKTERELFVLTLAAASEGVL